jgi:hypothetical protein
MSDSNRIRVSIIPEVTFGVTPTSSPAFLVLATTGVTLRDRIGYQQSRTINNDRNVLDLVRLSKAAGGGIPMELTYSPVGEGLMRLITAAFAGTETAAASVSTIEATEGVGTLTRGSGSFITDGYEVGDIVRVSGSSVAADNTFFKLSAVTALVLTVEGYTFATDSSSLVVVRGARIKNGTTQTTFSIEVARLDLQIAQIFTGCVIDSLDFTIADEAITTVNFSVQSA